MRRISVLALLAISRVASAAPIDLPPGEDVAAWADALVLAGLTEGPGGGGAHVEVVVSGDRWTIHAFDATGARREATVSAPRSTSQREEVAILAASLLRPLPSAGTPVASTLPPPAPPPPPPRVRPKPAETQPEPPPPEPTAAPPSPPPEPEPPAFRAGPFAQVGVGAELRPMVTPTVAASLRAGGVALPGLLVGVAGEVVGPAGVDDLDVSVAGLGAGGYLAWETATVVPILVSAEGGAAWRRFVDGNDEVAVEAFPWIGVGVGAAIVVDRAWAIVPELRMAGDLRATDLESAGEVLRLPGWSARAGVSARWGVVH